MCVYVQGLYPENRGRGGGKVSVNQYDELFDK